MTARKKLNSFYVYGCILTAGIVGLAFGSVAIFVIALIILVALNLHDGNIRPQGRRHAHHH